MVEDGSARCGGEAMVFSAAKLDPTIGTMIDGLRLTHEDDDVLLAQDMTFFESLFRSFDQAARSAGPRPVARPLHAKPRRKSVKRK